MYKKSIDFIRNYYLQSEKFIPLHAPTFTGLDKKYVLDAIDSTFVSSVGEYVNRFEHELAEFTGIKRAVATVNGTTALQIALSIVGVQKDDEVVTQPLTFVATANAIAHIGATPVFVDVDKDTMGLSPESLDLFFRENAEKKMGKVVNKISGRKISAIVPMHTFGHPCRISKIREIADKWSIPIVEDAAEAIGSWYEGDHCGAFGKVGVFSFNGNKTITCGGGGAILTNDDKLADRAKHLTTTAKIPHAWEYDHDEIGFNFRMPNLNAALGCAQLERLPEIIQKKRKLAFSYDIFFKDKKWATFMKEPSRSKSNYWLCSIVLNGEKEKNNFLTSLNNAGVMARPAWKLMTELSMYSMCQKGNINNSEWLSDRIVNLPSWVK